MPQWRYQGVTANGQRANGIIESPSKTQAIQALLAKGNTPQSITQISDTVGPLRFLENIRNRAKPSTKEMAIFLLDLAALLDARVPLREALSLCGQTAPSKSIRQMTALMADRLDAGATASSAVPSEGEEWTQLLSGLAEAGELSGRLPQSLRLGARLFERQAKTRQKVLGALAYPFFILTLGVIGVLVLILVVIPELAPVLQGQENNKLNDLFRFSKWLKQYGTVIPLGLAGVVTAIFFTAKIKTLQRVFSHIIVRTPFIGPIITDTNYGAVSQCLAALLSGGVSANKAFSLASVASRNPYIRDDIVRAGHRLANGNTVAATLEGLSLAPSEISRLALVGERTGALSPMLDRAGDILLNRAERRLDRLSTMVGPAMIIILGLGAGSAMSTILGALSSIGDQAF